jgi:hypothetical protein
MVLTMRAYIGTAQEAGMTGAYIEVSLRALCGTWAKKATARPRAVKRPHAPAHYPAA